MPTTLAGRMIVLRPDGAPVAGPANEHARKHCRRVGARFSVAAPKRIKTMNEEKKTKTSTELTVKRENDLQLCDAMLEATSSSDAKLLYKKGVWYLLGDEIPMGKEYIAYPMEAMHGAAKWEDDHVVEQRIGRIVDKFPKFKREDFPADEDWKSQVALALEDPETGEFVTFVSCSTGGSIGLNRLIKATARAVKKGTGDLAPLVRLSTGTFPSPEFGTIDRPEFEIVPRQSLKTEMNDTIPF
jgi:hypothetical protein